MPLPHPHRRETLGTGSSMKNSVVQCNVGNSSPVFLCSLFPKKAEISQLHLEFLSYCGQHFHPDNETYPFVSLLQESYGEDIADTETEKSANGSDKDEYEVLLACASVTKPKRKRKHANKKVLDAVKEHESKQDDFKTNSCDHELCLQDEYEKGVKPKSNRNEQADKKILDTDVRSHNNAVKEEKASKMSTSLTVWNMLCLCKRNKIRRNRALCEY
ncbi:unnamed protein product [Dovyalis caffra]|uniref:Uncharacterized protein n=1 Tax=Dovyalis caffra TaxID=77055 RepID=A0AAV1RVD5_9ROSI|nr:unnamed protein product [Dovyalis caffra]